MLPFTCLAPDPKKNKNRVKNMTRFRLNILVVHYSFTTFITCTFPPMLTLAK